MFEEKTRKKMNTQQEERAKQFAKLVAQIPDKEQERIFYMMQGIALVCEGGENGKAS